MCAKVLRSQVYRNMALIMGHRKPGRANQAVWDPAPLAFVRGCWNQDADIASGDMCPPLLPDILRAYEEEATPSVQVGHDFLLMMVRIGA